MRITQETVSIDSYYETFAEIFCTLVVAPVSHDVCVDTVRVTHGPYRQFIRSVIRDGEDPRDVVVSVTDVSQDEVEYDPVSFVVCHNATQLNMECYLCGDGKRAVTFTRFVGCWLWGCEGYRLLLPYFSLNKVYFPGVGWGGVVRTQSEIFVRPSLLF